jgi:SagB-type dehydrogenase family enzyme
MLDASDTRSLALVYHLNSEPWLDASADEQDAGDVRFKELCEGGESVALPPPSADGGLLELIRSRSSCRLYSPRPLALADLAELLAATYGVSRVVALDGIELATRSVPSAGALYPLEFYLVLKNVETVADGLYHYSIPGHALEPLRAGTDEATFAEAFLAAPLLENANALVLMTAVFDRTLHKYGARGYRYILLEAGHAAQNLCLLATERGLASLCVGGFMDAAINQFLGLDPRLEAAVYCVGLGHPG